MSGGDDALLDHLEAQLGLAEQEFTIAERKVIGLRVAVDAVRVYRGLPPKFPNGSGPNDRAGDTQQPAAPAVNIRPDSFYGKKQQTAVREFLEIRNRIGLGAAKPREIYEGIKAGGYQFETKDDETALVGLRAMLRKRTAFFHKLPNGAYGLTSWYPDAKKPKQPKAGDGIDAEPSLGEDAQVHSEDRVKTEAA